MIFFRISGGTFAHLFLLILLAFSRVNSHVGRALRTMLRAGTILMRCSLGSKAFLPVSEWMRSASHA
jgi:hypothetical protein